MLVPEGTLLSRVASRDLCMILIVLLKKWEDVVDESEDIMLSGIR